MSTELVWRIIRKSNSKSLRRTHPISNATVEKGSLRNSRCPIDSGLCRRKAVDVTPNDEGIPVLSLKNCSQADSRKPDKMWSEVTLGGGVRKALARTEKLVMAYCPALKKPAMMKVSAIYRAHAKMARGVNHTSILAVQ